MQPAGQDSRGRGAPGTVTVPLCLRTNASPFWIMLLLSLGVLEHGMIDAGRTPKAAATASGQFTDAGVTADAKIQTVGNSFQARLRITPCGRTKRGALLDPQGFDAGKKITGRKRHILVDTLGLLLSVA